jgi:hypothetical protein
MQMIGPPSNPGDFAMNKHHDQGKHRSVLDGKEQIAGLPSNKKSSVEKAAADKHAADQCDSVLDGPECIEGTPKHKDRH